MMIFVAFRLGMLTTTLGVPARKAWAIAILQPVAVFTVMIPMDSWSTILANPLVLGYGGAFFLIAVLWSYLTDRAGRPHIQSTHHLVQAYIRSRSGDLTDVESILEEWSKPSEVNTAQLSLNPQSLRWPCPLQSTSILFIVYTYPSDSTDSLHPGSAS